jgi:hypothetical protein
MFLRIGEPVRAPQFTRFIDVDRESTRHTHTADPKVLDMCTAPRLAFPGRCYAPVCLALRGVLPDALDQGKQVVDIDAVDQYPFGEGRLAA